MKATFKKNPELDFFVGYYGPDPIPTKQDQFKPLTGYQVNLKENGETKDLSAEYELYIKKKGEPNQVKFEDAFKEIIKRQLTSEHPYSKDIKLEVVVVVLMYEKRLKTVDVDNLLKSVLDCFTGLVFVDDSQVVNVFGTKQVHPNKVSNGILVGVRKLTDQKESWFNHITLGGFEYHE